MFFEEEEFVRERARQRRRAQQKKYSSQHIPEPEPPKKPCSNGYKYKFHPDPRFDPSEYLLTDEIRTRRLVGNYREELRRFRWGLYRVYGAQFNVLIRF